MRAARLRPGPVADAICALRFAETSWRRRGDGDAVMAWIDGENRALRRLAAAKPLTDTEMLAKAGEAVRRLYASIENGTQDAEVELGLAVLRDMRLDRLGVPS